VVECSFGSNTIQIRELVYAVEDCAAGHYDVVNG